MDPEGRPNHKQTTDQWKVLLWVVLKQLFAMVCVVCCKCVQLFFTFGDVLRAIGTSEFFSHHYAMVFI